LPVQRKILLAVLLLTTPQGYYLARSCASAEGLFTQVIHGPCRATPKS
jgi:hypothetical protein